MRKKILSAEMAVDILKRYVENEILESEIEIISCSSASNASSSTAESNEGLSTPPPFKRRKSVFDFINKVKESNPTTLKAKESEVDVYMKLETIDQTVSPLIFWGINQELYPNLAKLARQYLSMPACSGSVERLFSISGSLARARRSRLTISNVEKLLCCQQHIANY